jgi:hypothetical protein
MNKIDLIIDTIHELMYSNSTAVAMQKYYAALAAAKELREELTKPEECVCCGDYEKCIKPCTPKGRWLAEKELARPEHTFDTPESHIVKWSIPVDPNNFGEPLAKPEQDAVAVWELQEGGWDTIADADWMETLPIGTKLYALGQSK